MIRNATFATLFVVLFAFVGALLAQDGSDVKQQNVTEKEAELLAVMHENAKALLSYHMAMREAGVALTPDQLAEGFIKSSMRLAEVEIQMQPSDKKHAITALNDHLNRMAPIRDDAARLECFGPNVDLITVDFNIAETKLRIELLKQSI